MRHDANMLSISGVEGDYDAGQVSIEEAAIRLQGAGIEAVLYTTARHTPEAPRWRVLAPLAARHPPSDRRALAGVLNTVLGGILAVESFTDSLAYYVGKVTGAHYDWRRVKGRCLDDGAHLFFEPCFPSSVAPERAERDDFSRAATLAGVTDETVRDLTLAVHALNPSRAAAGNNPQWYAVLQALKSLEQAGRPNEALKLAHEFSAKGGAAYVPAEVDRRWATLKPERVTYKSIFSWATEDGWINPKKGISPDDSDDVALSDVYLSRKLGDLLDGRFLFEHGARGWLVYESGAWRPAGKGEVVEQAKGLGAHLLREAAGETLDTDKTTRVTKLVNRAMSSAGINAAMQLVESDPRIAASPTEFDRDPDILNVQNGVLHLPSLQLRPHDPAFRLSRQCPVPYEPSAIAPQWGHFLAAVSRNDPDWIDYLQRACGYTLSGSVVEELLFFLLGHGANGKSVFANIQRRIAGTYGTAVPAGFLNVSKRDGESSTPSMATLPGARLALANEVEAGARLSAQIVKVACSTELIAARANYGNPFLFLPTHKLWVRGNHKPVVTDNDEGIWRRIVLIPFDRNFAPDERDTELETRLFGEAPGILLWMLRGYTEYRRRGLKPTGRIAAASLSYRKESDVLGQWIDEAATLDPGGEALQGIAYADYQTWCGGQGLRPIAKKSFTRGLVERGITERQQSSGARQRLYVGLRLLSNF